MRSCIADAQGSSGKEGRNYHSPAPSSQIYVAWPGGETPSSSPLSRPSPGLVLTETSTDASFRRVHCHTNRILPAVSWMMRDRMLMWWKEKHERQESLRRRRHPMRPVLCATPYVAFDVHHGQAGIDTLPGIKRQLVVSQASRKEAGQSTPHCIFILSRSPIACGTRSPNQPCQRQ